MTIVHLNGVDPGLVHTGVVDLLIDNQKRNIRVQAHVIDGPDVAAVAAKVDRKALLYIEKYEDRGTSFDTHSEMRTFETLLRKELPHATVLSNTGVRKVVTDMMLSVLVGDLPTTNHKDLESAARIALYGGLKIPAINSVLYHATIDHLAGRSWARS